MKPFIFGARDKVHIINLEQTVPMFNDALGFLYQVFLLRKVKSFLLVLSALLAMQLKMLLIKCDQFYVNHRWLGGMLTNWKTVRQSIKRLKRS